jgi:hypothetical protein
MKNCRHRPPSPTLRRSKRPDHTLAILVPTNQTGYLLADHLDELGADYDNLLRGGSREREIAAAMHAILALLADPLNTQSAGRCPRQPARSGPSRRPPFRPKSCPACTPSCAAFTSRKLLLFPARWRKAPCPPV